MTLYLEKVRHLEFCPPPSAARYRGQGQGLISRTSSADENEAVAALISLPSLGRRNDHDTTPNHESNALHIIPNYRFCHPAMSQRMASSSYFSGASLINPSTSSCSQSSSSTGSAESAFGNECIRHPLAETTQGSWYSGSTSLALPEDDDVLSPLHGYMRKYCIEAFSATQDDVSSPRYGKSHNGKIVVGQVGIRCLHCKHLDHRKRPERAVCYPSTLRNIYHSMETWQRRHSSVCTEIPLWVRREMAALMRISRSNAGGRRQYWEDAAKQLGLVDTPHGVRFARPPGLIRDSSSLGRKTSSQPRTRGRAIVEPEDRELVTDYLHLLMNQMQVCYFADEDRTGSRSKVKTFDIGFPGLECKHCRGMAGFGRYFPSSADSLALANSDRNIFNHLMKCRKCPETVQNKLVEYQEKGESAKNKRGSRKFFFQRVWDRIHNGGEGE